MTSACLHQNAHINHSQRIKNFDCLVGFRLRGNDEQIGTRDAPNQKMTVLMRKREVALPVFKENTILEIPDTNACPPPPIDW
jgi:hypothetical protein